MAVSSSSSHQTPSSSTISLSSSTKKQEELKFNVLVSLFSHISKAKSTPIKRKKIRKFLDAYGSFIDYFSAIRLILPSLDRERGSYGLKESVLATSLLDALGISRDSEDAKTLVNWRKGGAKVAGRFAGNFSLVAADVLQRRQSSVSGGITICEVNELLDRLAKGENRSAKVEILGEMIRKTNSNEMKWIIMIILKDLKLGISEKSVFHEFHPDAEDLFNVTCNLKYVCERLTDRNERDKREDIEVGRPVRPQMAFRVPSVEAAWKRLQGKEVVVECKFDGDRIQVHKNGDQVTYFSRKFYEHNEYSHGMSNVIVENVLVDKCIFDGEMLVWDRSTNRFAEFGSNQEIAKAARDGLEGDKHLCYVAFDVLYVGDTSVIHQSLKERQELLRKVVRPVKGRLEVVLPNGASDPCWSIVANHVDDAVRFFKELIKNRDEGVVLKDLGSKWEPDDRNGKWLKVKPDYGRAGADLDVLIIGGYYGSGRRGGEVAQFLVGVAERPPPGSYPRKFLSFCRVGTGLTDEECNELVTKLKPYFSKYEYGKKPPPNFYQVTNNSKERPDVWIESPENSVLVTITSEVRVITSEVFASPYSLRFPRIDRVRYDKPWHECLDVQSLKELVAANNGTTRRQGGADAEGLPKPKRARNGGKKRLGFSLPSHFTQTDVSSVKGESQIFSDMVFHFVNVPQDRSLDSMHKLVVENGGTFSMNLNNTVTHCIGAQSRGLKYEAAKRRGSDVIHCSWVLDCCSQKQLLPLRPMHFLFLSDSRRNKLKEEIDEFSDSYFWDLNVVELKQIFCNVNTSEDAKSVEYYKKKYCPREKWGCFHGCSVYFHLFANSHPAEWDIFLKIATRRLKVEVSLGGGKDTDNLPQATHIVIMSVPGHKLDFETLLQSLPCDLERKFRRKRLHVVGSQWIEDCIKEERKLPEAAYSLKPATLEESASEVEEDEIGKDHEKHLVAPAYEEKPMKIDSKTISHIREPLRKRGRPVGASTKKGKPVVSKPPRTKRARLGSRPAKLHIASDDEISDQETDAPARASPERETHDHVFQDIAFDETPSIREPDIPVKSGLEIENAVSDSRHDSSERNEESKEEEHKPEPHKKDNHCVDNPVQAMLLNLLPGLRGKSEATNPISEDKNLSSTKPEEGSSLEPSQVFGEKLPGLRGKSEVTNSISEDKILSSTKPEEGCSLEPSQVEPVKKKKVSYRELAMQLLKD